MRVLLVTGRFPVRSETFIYRKAVALARRGHEVTVATRGAGEWDLYPDPLPPGVRVVELPPDHSLRDPRRAWAALTETAAGTARSWSSARQLYERCRTDPRTRDDPRRHYVRHLPLLDLRPQLVHFEFLGLGTMYPLAAELLDVPMIVSCRGSDVHTLELQPAAERDAAIECLRRAAAVHCVSAKMATEVERITGRAAGLWVNRPALDVERITPARTRDKPHPIRLLATGRLVWIKGFDYLLAAAGELARRGVAFRLEILGDGELKKSLRYAIEDLGLQDSVSLVGAVSASEVLDRMQAADMFVLSSLGEGISNAVLEAMATGLPIVTTAAGGMAEAVGDGREGVVVPVRDSKALADAIERLALDSELRARMGAAARTRAEREFSIARQVETFEKIYRYVIE